MTFILNTVANFATFLPILPKPMIPKVLRYNSDPFKLLLVHSIFFILSLANVIFLDKASIKEIVNSATT